MKTHKILHRLRNDSAGTAVIEFALLLPLLVTMFFGVFEMSRYILINHKLEKSVYTVSDVVAQQTSVTTSQLDQIVTAASEIMQPFVIGNQGNIVLSSVYQNGTANPPTVQWQYSGGGTAAHASMVGTVGSYATLPGSLTLNDKDNVIVAEFFYDFTPFFTGGPLETTSLHKYAIFKPRLGALTTPPN